MSQEIRSLLCPLSDEDLKVRSHNLAASVKEREQVELEKKGTVAKFTQQLKDIDERIDQLATVVKARHEARPVPCDWIVDGKKGVKRLVRLDTEDVIDTKALTMDERQSTLPFSSSAKKVEDAKAAGTNGNGEKKAKKAGKSVKAAETPATA